MSDFKDTYRCPDCGRTGAPISDEASADEYKRGWHVTCPECGFSISGRTKTTVMQALAAIHLWQARVDEVMGDSPMGIDVVTELRAQEVCQRGPRGNATYLSDLNKRAADEIDRLRYVLAGVRGAIQTGRNEPLVIWKEQIDIALDDKPKRPTT